ncbi:hypothetical protein OB955_12570 [Halobacteria archaeon AArc-m2/3/4]|uniref:Uncharacterized protein n=1 Tax=Natronoglomus mannanivorans TaxID=2979990 RepID=A0ABT2QF68_9EURY|nr:hypothetical protein [Halobacteria archaeon AArc-m2/3/4]
MYGLVRGCGYVALLLTPVALLGSALLAPRDASAGIVGLEVGIGIALAGGLAAVAERERALGRLHVDAAEFDRADVVDVLAVVAGALFAYVLSVHAGLGPVLGSAFVGLVAGLGADDLDGPVYCGSFVGMTSPTLFPSAAYLVGAGLVAGLAYVATRGTFVGMGGKLGTIALFGCATAVVLAGVDYGVESALQWDSARVVVPAAVVGAVSTVVLSVRLELGAVVGSAFVGLVAGIAFPTLLPELGETVAAVAFCASFVGMSSTGRLRGEAHVALAGCLCGLVFIVVTPAFVGAGGKLGTVAFVSCVTVSGIRVLSEMLIARSV